MESTLTPSVLTAAPITDTVEREYEALGFANKFYTLWLCIERKYSKTYIYRKNVSFSEEKARALYPNCEINKELHGKTRSFTVHIGALGGSDTEHFFYGFRPHKSVDTGTPVSINRFIVTSVSQVRTRYNKPYTAVIGEDIDGLDRYAINIFNFTTDIPAKGDILKLNAVVALYSEKNNLIYLNDAKWEFTTTRKKEIVDTMENGTKLKGVTMICTFSADPTLINVMGRTIVDKNGFACFEDEDGNMYNFDTVTRGFRTGIPQYKFDTATYNELRCGSMWKVSGTVQKNNGYNRLIRVKLELIEKAPEYKEEDRKFYHIARVTETKYTPNPDRRKRDVMEKSLFNMEITDMDELIKSIVNLTNEHQGSLMVQGYNVDPATVEGAKSKIDEVNSHYNTVSSEYYFNIEIPAAKTRIVYVVNFFEE